MVSQHTPCPKTAVYLRWDAPSSIVGIWRPSKRRRWVRIPEKAHSNRSQSTPGNMGFAVNNGLATKKLMCRGCGEGLTQIG